jgi:ferri-bacillibactin esterase
MRSVASMSEKRVGARLWRTRYISAACLVYIGGIGYSSPLLGDSRRAASDVAQPRSVRISIPNTRRIDFISKVNGHRYSISIALPFERAPARGYRVLYVLDGYSYFASATEAVRGFGNAPGVIVVGIGYPDDEAFVRSVLAKRGPVPNWLRAQPRWRCAAQLERIFDLTLPASDKELDDQAFPGDPRQKSQNVGGLDDFLKTIEAEVRPRVASLVAVDPTEQALFGHSLGGLAVLHALFVEPNAFRAFIIASPSIWWNNRAVLIDERKFATTIDSGQASPRVLVTMGSEESTPPRYPASWGIDDDALKPFYQKVRMVENGAELVTRLKALHGRPGYVVEDYGVFDKLGHNLSPWPALARGISLAFSTKYH